MAEATLTVIHPELRLLTKQLELDVVQMYRCWCCISTPRLALANISPVVGLS
jgi:hypothetical protein